MRRFFLIFFVFFSVSVFAQNFILDSIYELNETYNNFMQNEFSQEKYQQLSFDQDKISQIYTETLIKLIESFMDDILYETIPEEELYYSEALLYFEVLFYTSYLKDFYFQTNPELQNLIAELFEKDFSPKYFVFNPYLPLTKNFFSTIHKRIDSFVQSHWLEQNLDSSLYDDFENEYVSQSYTKDLGKKYEVKRFYAIHAIETIYLKFLDFQKKQEKDMILQLSEEVFYSILNEPQSLFVLLHNERYTSLKESFFASAAYFLQIEKSFFESMQTSLEDYIYLKPMDLFFENFYSLVYEKSKAEYKNDYSALIYSINDLIYESFVVSALYGFSFESVLLPENRMYYEILLEEPFMLMIFDQKSLENLKSNLSFISFVSKIYVERMNALPVFQMRGR